ncbi:iron-containing alcohol dehydrogenase [Streptomyces sp. NPDC005485]|uniref:iron-containing alcohol dehydrogenase n=1 Tax=Streptomyces sp. NPDC005485 TaxID=3155591 RepID=UPI0033B518D8
MHGMSRPIGAHFHVAHALSDAMLFPAVTAFSVRGAKSRYADCARALGAATDGEVPTLRAHGIDKNDWFRLAPVMAEQALASGSPRNNPVVPTADAIHDLYRRIYA